MGSGRGVHGKENPRKLYAAGLRTEPAPLVRGSSQDHDYAVSTREYQSDQPSRKLPRPRLTLPSREGRRRRKPLLVVDRSFHISAVGLPEWLYVKVPSAAGRFVESAGS